MLMQSKEDDTAKTWSHSPYWLQISGSPVACLDGRVDITDRLSLPGLQISKQQAAQNIRTSEHRTSPPFWQDSKSTLSALRAAHTGRSTVNSWMALTQLDLHGSGGKGRAYSFHTVLWDSQCGGISFISQHSRVL